MFEIPEYHSLKSNDDNEETVTVSVRIDGDANMMPTIKLHPRVIARLVEAFCSGNLDFMAFDEHPKRLTGINVRRAARTPTVILTARSLTEKDGLTRDWQIADPQIYGVST
jgi:hypothetical protein